MELRNQTSIDHFILIGFSQDFQICIFLFVLFFASYILIVLGNSFLILTVVISPKLHTPMYYFLCNLSFLDLCYSSSTVPKLLYDIFASKRRISLIGCITQLIMFTFLAVMECTLLAVMAYDRYIAICFPLHYTTIMSWRVCRYITVIMWSGSLILASFPTISKPLIFCTENALNHFFCEIMVLLQVACENVPFHRIAVLAGSTFPLLISPAFIMVSYISIIISILKIRSSEGRSKAFSTCASHLTVVLMFFGTTMTMYLGSTKGSTSRLKYIAIFYTVITPVLNPLVYSLRNNEVKQAFWNILAPVSQL